MAIFGLLIGMTNIPATRMLELILKVWTGNMDGSGEWFTREARKTRLLRVEISWI
jgi:hypothetical protein